MGSTNWNSCCCGSPVMECKTPTGTHSDQCQPEHHHFMEEYQKTLIGDIPKVKTKLEWRDTLGAISARSGFGRNNYNIQPGLYCAGNPGPDSPVLVTANYKLSFDALRKELDSLSVWILVLDTAGINVWCSAGKGTFSAEEVSTRVKQVELEKLVRHRKLILPQLSATGVCAKDVKRYCDFTVIWGPIQAIDIKPFLSNRMKADPTMRRITFPLRERLALIPVELYALRKYMLWTMLVVFLLSGIGSEIFSFHAAWTRGLLLIAACLAGIFAGVVTTPILLPWIPGRAFSLKGAITGIILGAGVVWMFWNGINGYEAAALLLCTTSVASFLAMNFTGATPFTSPSGVEKEMRKAIPLQSVAVLVLVVGWIGSVFIV